MTIGVTSLINVVMDELGGVNRKEERSFKLNVMVYIQVM